MFDSWTLAWATVPSSQSIGGSRIRQLTQIFRVVLHGQSPSQLSPGPQQIDDRGPDGRRQTVPVCDQLVECRTLPAHFRPGTSHHVVTTLRADNCGNRASGAIPAASISCVTSRLSAMIYVYLRCGFVSR